MRLGVLSDTHGNYVRTNHAVEVFQSHDVDLVIHCGDVGNVAIVALLDPWPTHFVTGNVDHAGELSRTVAERGQTFHDQLAMLELEGKRIAFLHGHNERLLRETVQSGQYDLICRGHTHIAEQSFHGETLVLNPGAIHRTANPSVALVDLPSLRVVMVSLPSG